MDIKTLCSVASVILSFCTFIGGAIAFCIIKFNDFHHMDKNFNETKQQIDDKFKIVNTKLDLLTNQGNDNEKQIAIINERCENQINKKRKKTKDKRRKL